jgi:hypothetical protein
MLFAAADSVAVDTYDVAFRNLCEHPLGRHQHRAPGHDVECLGGRISVIEVHLMGLESPAAIGAWDAPKIAKELDHPCLADADSLEFQGPVPAVVLDVV